MTNGEIEMIGKSGKLWVLSILTGIAFIHLLDAVSALIFGSPIQLIRYYPFLDQIGILVSPSTYFWSSVFSTIVLWGLTCRTLCQNPLDMVLNTILADTANENALESDLINEKATLINLMNETVLVNNTLLGKIKDLSSNIRAEVKDIRPLKERLKNIDHELIELKNELHFLRTVNFLTKSPRQ